MYYLCLSNIWPETFAARNPFRSPSIASTLSQLRRKVDCDPFDDHAVDDGDLFHHHGGKGSSGDDNNDHGV